MRSRPAGVRAVLLEVGGPAGVVAVRAAVARLVADGQLPAPAEVVPGARTLLLDGVDVAAVSRLLSGSALPARTDDVVAAPPGPLVEVPVVYDGADLAEVARLWGVPPQEVVARHTAAEFEVAFCGFAPGFPYLVGLDTDVPRRATPRSRVPAGSVALAGRYCGIYPTASPGGWQLIGTTDAELFAVDRDPPALLPPGTRVRFVTAADGGRATGATATGGTATGGTATGGTAARRPVPLRPAPGQRALAVVRAGALTTVQDAGRPGLAHLGVPRAGPLDGAAARLANRLVGNPEGAALLETTVDGCALRAWTALTVAVTGAPAPVTAHGRTASWGVAVGVAAGGLLEVGRATHGVRSYVAVAGGLEVAPVLGSRSGDTLSGLGPAPLTAGDVLPVGPPGAPPPVEFTVPRSARDPVVLRVRPGPRDDRFGVPGAAALLAGPWTLSPLSNRVGARLAGPAVPRLTTDELESEGIVLGAVQVPPDGRPVVLLADHPTTGGYPVIGVVESADLDELAQARPGTSIQFGQHVGGSGWPA